MQTNNAVRATKTGHATMGWQCSGHSLSATVTAAMLEVH